MLKTVQVFFFELTFLYRLVFSSLAIGKSTLCYISNSLFDIWPLVMCSKRWCSFQLEVFFFFFWEGSFFFLIFFFLLYNIVLVLPYINMRHQLEVLRDNSSEVLHSVIGMFRELKVFVTIKWGSSLLPCFQNDIKKEARLHSFSISGHGHK